MNKNPHKKNQPKDKNQPVIDQQNQPCCRAIWKKIRNVNKKITQIQDLQKRDDLKPQQVEKINRKQNLLDQKAKYQEFLELYKNVLTQNAQTYREQQMKQLNHLAQTLALASYSKSNSGYKTNQISNLLSLMQNLSPNQTVQERSNKLSQTFINLASDRKFRQWISKNFNENAANTYNVKVQTQEKPKVQDTPKKAKNTPKVETPKPEKVEEKQQIKAQPVVQVKTQEVPSNDVLVEKKQNTEQQKPVQDPKKEEDKKQERQKGPRGPRGPRGPPRQGNRDNNNKRRYNNDRRKYKPKNDKKEGQNNEDSSSSEPQQNELEIRDFKREQVRQLIEDGFVVVGKPKIKSHEQKQWHDHTHGRKQYHYHHTKQNH